MIICYYFKMDILVSLLFISTYIRVAFGFEAAFIRNSSETLVLEPVFPLNFPAGGTGDEVQHIHDFQELWYVLMEEAKLNRMAQNSSTPTYMLDLYRSIKGPRVSIHPSETEASVIRDSDTVRSFLPIESDVEETQGRFSFNLSVIEPEEDIRLCEIRVADKMFRWTAEEIRISIYQTCRKACEEPLSDGCSSSTRIASMMSPLRRDDDEDQFVFDVTRSVRYALQIERSAYCELEVILSGDVLDSFKPIDGGRRKRAILGRIDVASGKFIPVDTTATHNQTDSVVLVLFTHDRNPKNVLRDAEVRQRSGSSLQDDADIMRARRDLREDRRRKKERDRSKEKKQQLEIERTEKFAAEVATPTCQKVTFEINFQHIGWSRWIIYPQKFEAFRCEGSCTGPMNRDHNPSNHAVMQSLVNLNRPDLVPAACCVPTKLVPLSMLYFEQGTIALKHHDEMVVEECGCR